MSREVKTANITGDMFIARLLPDLPSEPSKKSGRDNSGTPVLRKGCARDDWPVLIKLRTSTASNRVEQFKPVVVW